MMETSSTNSEYMSLLLTKALEVVLVQEEVDHIEGDSSFGSDEVDWLS